MADEGVHWDEESLWDLLNSPDGPVGRLLTRLSDQVAAVAVAEVHVRGPRSRGGRTAHPPGYTKASIHPVLGWGKTGLIYGGANAVANPTIFLEYPAIQMHERYPFLTTGLWSLEGTL